MQDPATHRSYTAATEMARDPFAQAKAGGERHFRVEDEEVCVVVVVAAHSLAPLRCPHRLKISYRPRIRTSHRSLLLAWRMIFRNIRCGLSSHSLDSCGRSFAPTVLTLRSSTSRLGRVLRQLPSSARVGLSSKAALCVFDGASPSRWITWIGRSA